VLQLPSGPDDHTLSINGHSLSQHQFQFDTFSLFNNTSTSDFDFSFNSYDPNTTTLTSSADNGPIDVTTWPEFQFDPTQLTQVPLISSADHMQALAQNLATFDHPHPFSAAADLDVTSLGGTTPPSLFTTHAPSPISGSASGSPSTPFLSITDDFAPVTTATHSGLTLPKAATQPRKRGRPPREARSASPDEDVLVKRQRNNVAAKKYRQKKIDRIGELENEVESVRKERDELRILLARQEAETKALREMLSLKMGGKEG